MTVFVNNIFVSAEININAIYYKHTLKQHCPMGDAKLQRVNLEMLYFTLEDHPSALVK
jgi:hypothetical protein